MQAFEAVERRPRDAATPTAGGARRRHAVSAPGEPRYVAFLYLAPALALFACFALGPLLYTVWLSFFAWDGLSPGVWVGFDNYRQVFSDPQLRSAFVHALELIAFFAVFPTLIGLLLAALVSHAGMRGTPVFRAILFLPQTIPTVVVAIAWVWIYGPDGSLNSVLRAIGLGGLARGWLGDYGFALPALGLVGTWINFGLCFVLFLAGMQKIPPSLYDAARVDGAGRLSQFFAVTLPAIRGELAVALTLMTIVALRAFDLIYVATAGGPGTQTTTPSLLVYLDAFSHGAVGLAAALAVVLTAFIYLFVFLIARTVERRGT